MKSNFKKKMFVTEAEMQKYIQNEWDNRTNEVFEECKRDIVAQFMAVCCTELNKEFKFGKIKLNRFKTGVESIFKLMTNDGILGKPFTTENCIKAMKDKYGIDFDEREENQLP
jgi:hypothetical protein